MEIRGDCFSFIFFGLSFFLSFDSSFTRTNKSALLRSIGLSRSIEGERGSKFPIQRISAMMRFFFFFDFSRFKKRSTSLDNFDATRSCGNNSLMHRETLWLIKFRRYFEYLMCLNANNSISKLGSRV